ncbi:alpha-1,4-glucan:maltose-1-phosphate maltosyltransferase [Thermogymnomonas acidicola]|uniref:Alpha-1,4-glucan:maltose-1-phosphate maltosyltransferase n=1 Tax=Thermogymnomonas acidicola TaxID=399579 RepID=A0AA37BTC7_9ARCH|nr:alpha-1,4-glucan:maltose-1-phosphate maltosyltransferase [Thermogymnomonas acidicola]
MVECNRYPVKRTVGEDVEVRARVFSHGTDVVLAALRYRAAGGRWKEVRMRPQPDDYFTASFTIERLSDYEFSVAGWHSPLLTWARDFAKWYASGEDVSMDAEEGREILSRALGKRPASRAAVLKRLMEAIVARDYGTIASLSTSPGLTEAAFLFDRRLHLEEGEAVRVRVEREEARFASWYEFFPRSCTSDPGKHGTLRDCTAMLRHARDLGFDTVYITPIHPIGRTNRRGKNGVIPCAPGDPGSPWAIGSDEGGHKSVNPDLGTLEDFREFLRKARSMGLEVAMDIALQCSPDHPYVREHPEWFRHRKDGSIRYAENPPKKYFDIYPFDFDTTDREGLWNEMLSIFLFWAEQGVRAFRVDNPHTKPTDFWEWLIAKVREKYPDAIFLAEAFTRPSIMYELSKVGFSMSYTYFTWRNYDYEIRDYFTEINSGEVAEHFRPMLFTNTPDILTDVLQKGGRPAFMMRAVLAATLSPLWGIYSGFELCENRARPNSEEYLDSEKYEVKARDFGAPGNINAFIARLNQIRRECRPLQFFRNVEFYRSDNPNIVCYSRWHGDEWVYVVVNVNPFEEHSATVQVPVWKFGIGFNEPYRMEDLLSGEVYNWVGEYNYVKLTPGERCAHVLRRRA